MNRNEELGRWLLGEHMAKAPFVPFAASKDLEYLGPGL